MSKYDFEQVEESVLTFWDAQNIKKKLEERNKGGEKFYFLDGPPYTSGAIHLGHAWNKSAKDLLLRYKRMRGFDVFDRAGYDMHGLPTENKVQAAHNLASKKDIEKFGVDKFVEACIAFSKEKADAMDKDFKRLGVWMDFENAYKPINNSYMSNIWWLVKRAHEEGRLYEGKKTMMWDPVGETALAKHEVVYKEVTDQAIFVKFKVVGTDNEYLVIWTTTPWTIPFNLAIMVNPDITYVKCDVDGELYIVAKDLAEDFIVHRLKKELIIVEEVRGVDLEGLKYEHPFADKINYTSIEKEAPKTHTVVLSKEYVTTQAGTGLVHCAPGCGPEDYEVGHANGLPAFNLLKEDGSFSEEAGEFKGLRAKEDDKEFISLLGDAVLAKQTYRHDYPFSERTNAPVVFRATTQWFFRVEDLKENMIEANKDIHWVPQSGKNAFNSWLENLRDNSITKQRYFGTPVPIWKNVDDPSDYLVIGSQQELEELSGQTIENLHKPYIDEVIIEKDGKQYKRIPDVLDVWIDAGSASWNALDYPQRKDFFERFFPADFILEGKDQIRGWFNLLMVASMITMKKPSFKNVYMHGFITDFEGEKMSKSKGNIVSPYEIITKYGADTLRYYTIEITAGEDMSFSWDEVKLKSRNLQVLWNVHNWLIDFAKTNNFTVTGELKANVDELLQKYMISKLFSTIRDVTAHLENYELHRVPRLIEDLFLELSRTYIQFVREKSVLGTPEEKQVIFETVLLTLLETLKMLSIVCPFIAEQMYLNLKAVFDFPEESITLFEWPRVEEALIDEEIEEVFFIGGKIIESILASREKAKLGVRWPVGEVVVEGDEQVRNAATLMADLIKTQTNVKKLTITDKFDQATEEVKPNFAKIGPEFGKLASKIVEHVNSLRREELMVNEDELVLDVEGQEVRLTRNHFIFSKNVPDQWILGEIRGGFTYLDTLRTHELDAEGYAREVMRRIQSLRKEAGLSKTDEISLQISGDSELIEMLKLHKEVIKEKCGCSQISFVPKVEAQHCATEKVKGHEFTIGF
ncbi:isoleucine--tRNA ligase [Candidatus Woesearchaeota archaeon]|nr:MAG: isoleucine--tRNA ligase [Candidatus Woesearchaeota archaeon]